MSDVTSAPAVAGNEPSSAPVVDPNTIGEGGERPAQAHEAEKPNAAKSLAERWKKERDEKGKFKKDKTTSPEQEVKGNRNPDTDIEKQVETKSTEQKDEEKPEDKGAALRHARALADLKKAQKDTLELKAKYEETHTAFETFKAEFAKNPLKALERATGDSFMNIMKKAAAGQFDVQQVPDEIRKELDELKAFRDEERKAREEQTTSAQREADNKLVKSFLDQRADDYPIFASLEWGVEELREAAYAHLKEHGEQPNLGELAKELEERAAKTLSATLSQERIAKAVARNPEVRAALVKALGFQPAAAAPKPAAQPTLTNATTQAAPASESKPKRATVAGEIDEDTIARYKAFRASGKLDL